MRIINHANLRLYLLSRSRYRLCCWGTYVGFKNEIRLIFLICSQLLTDNLRSFNYTATLLLIWQILYLLFGYASLRVDLRYLFELPRELLINTHADWEISTSCDRRYFYFYLLFCFQKRRSWRHLEGIREIVETSDLRELIALLVKNSICIRLHSNSPIFIKILCISCNTSAVHCLVRLLSNSLLQR